MYDIVGFILLDPILRLLRSKHSKQGHVLEFCVYIVYCLLVANQNKETCTLGRFLAHASILCTVMGADQNKESFPYPGVGCACLCYCSSQKSEYTFRVNEIRLGTAKRVEEQVRLNCRTPKVYCVGV